MKVLLADPEGSFFKHNTELTLRRPLSDTELDAYKAKLDDAAARLRTLERVAGQQVEIRLYQDQLRLPIIIIDDRRAIVTVRLPPYEAKESFRIEFEGGFDSQSVTHFNRIWNDSASYQGTGE